MLDASHNMNSDRHDAHSSPTPYISSAFPAPLYCQELHLINITESLIGGGSDAEKRDAPLLALQSSTPPVASSLTSVPCLLLCLNSHGGLQLLCSSTMGTI